MVLIVLARRTSDSGRQEEAEITELTTAGDRGAQRFSECSEQPVANRIRPALIPKVCATPRRCHRDKVETHRSGWFPGRLALFTLRTGRPVLRTVDTPESPAESTA